jgi:hypothetical protein
MQFGSIVLAVVGAIVIVLNSGGETRRRLLLDPEFTISSSSSGSISDFANHTSSEMISLGSGLLLNTTSVADVGGMLVTHAGFGGFGTGMRLQLWQGIAQVGMDTRRRLLGDEKGSDEKEEKPCVDNDEFLCKKNALACNDRAHKHYAAQRELCLKTCALCSESGSVHAGHSESTTNARGGSSSSSSSSSEGSSSNIEKVGTGNSRSLHPGMSSSTRYLLGNLFLIMECVCMALLLVLQVNKRQTKTKMLRLQYRSLPFHMRSVCVVTCLRNGCEMYVL